MYMYIYSSAHPDSCTVGNTLRGASIYCYFGAAEIEHRTLSKNVVSNSKHEFWDRIVYFEISVSIFTNISSDQTLRISFTCLYIK
jgi:hypothetical protein